MEKLYHGNIRLNNKQFDRTSHYARFCEILTENELHLLSQLVNTQAEVSGYSKMEQFIEGFRVGARFTLDAYVMPDNNVIRDIE